MSGISDHLLHDIAGRVARRVSDAEPSTLPGRYAVLVVSGEGPALEDAIDRLQAERGSVVAVADRRSGAVGAVLARIPGARIVTDDSTVDVNALLAGADRVVAPALELGLASRITAMQADTLTSRVALRALLAGLRVEASLDEREFFIADTAAPAAREALDGIVSRLRALGVDVAGVDRRLPSRNHLATAASYGAGPHPSQERFSLSQPIDEFVEFLESRPCTIEVGKPCIACGVCEARGF
jgi:hypothetical protein